MKLGIDVLSEDKKIQSLLKKKRIALLGHEASVDSELNFTLDLLCKHLKLNVVKVFGPQHGFCSDKQDDMKESGDFLHPIYKIPVHSLYGEVRKPRDIDVQDIDAFVIDLQDVGCRIYTYVTTLLYVLESAAKNSKQVFVLDRPNPIGRNVEGFNLEDSMVSFVGALPGLSFRHGLTLGELAKYFVATAKLDVDLEVIKMEGWNPSDPSKAWSDGSLAWVNPSPNLPRLSSVQAFCGTVLLEGTLLSEGRGTTRPLELWGHPQAKPTVTVKKMAELCPEWMLGVKLRECHFEPTFQKHVHNLCKGFQLHCEHKSFDDHLFKPFRFFALLFKALRLECPSILKWKQPPYEYEHERLAIDLLSGSSLLREWVDDSTSKVEELEQALKKDEKQWEQIRRPFMIY